jgi:NADPH:quinone reductase
MAALLPSRPYHVLGWDVAGTVDAVGAGAGIDPVAASTLPVNALTALAALDRLDLREGQILAVTGAGGAVGGYAVELARHRGIQTVAFGAAQDELFLTGLGATFVPRGDDPASKLRSAAPDGADGLLDTAAIGAPVLGAVRDGGAFVAVLPPAAPPAERGIRVDTIGVHSDGAQLAELAQLVQHGQLTLRVAQTLPFTQAAHAHALFAKGGTRGRLVLTP